MTLAQKTGCNEDEDTLNEICLDFEIGGYHRCSETTLMMEELVMVS